MIKNSLKSDLSGLRRGRFGKAGQRKQKALIYLHKERAVVLQSVKSVPFMNTTVAPHLWPSEFLFMKVDL